MDIQYYLLWNCNEPFPHNLEAADVCARVLVNVGVGGEGGAYVNVYPSVTS